MQTFQSLLAQRFAEALGKAGLPEAGELTPASDPQFGDYQSNAALMLGKQCGENPRALAAKILAHLNVTDLAEQPQVAGGGFINFTLRVDAVAAKTRELLADERFGGLGAALPKKTGVDFV